MAARHTLRPNPVIKAMTGGCTADSFPPCLMKPWGIIPICMNTAWLYGPTGSRFRSPVLIGETIEIVTKVKRRKGLLLEMTGEVIRPDGTVAAEADAKMMYEGER